MRRIKVLHVITRWVAGGARQMVASLMRGLDRSSFDPALAIGEFDGELPDVPHFYLPRLKREVRPVDDLRSAILLARAIDGWRPDVVHGHTYKAGVLASIVARLLGVHAVVFSPHGHIFGHEAEIPGVPYAGWKRAMLYWIHGAAGACAHRVTTLSTADLEEHRRLALAPTPKLVVIENGVDLARFDVARRAPGFALTSIGRLSAEKGHRVLLDAMPRIRRQYPQATLTIVGDGPERAALESRAEGVTFAGHREDTPPILAGTDVYVHPSLYEGLGLAIAEAMAARCPVVATRVGGVPALVRDGSTGLLVPPNNPEALAGGVIHLLSDPQRAARFGAAGRAHVEANFSLARMVSRYERLYRELAG